VLVLVIVLVLDVLPLLIGLVGGAQANPKTAVANSINQVKFLVLIFIIPSLFSKLV
jgi:hypothetical protein